MSIAQMSPVSAPPFSRRIAPLTRVFNPLLVRVAGRRGFPVFAIVHHRGRNTGSEYATPVAVRAHGDQIGLPLAFGEQAAWCRNVVAAGGCSVRWKGADIALTDPRVVDFATVRSTYPWLLRLIATRVFGIQRVLLLSRV